MICFPFRAVAFATSLVACVFSSVHAQHDHSHDKDLLARPLYVPEVTYTIRAEVFPESSLVKGTMDIEYRNSSADTLREIHLYLGPGSYPVGHELDFHDINLGDSVEYNSHSSEGPYCRLDSILFRAARLDRNPVMVDSSTMRVYLPVALPPGEVAPFVVAFRARLAAPGTRPPGSNGWQVATDWIPRVTVYRGGTWHTGRPDRLLTNDSESARFNVALRVDSSYMLIVPGKLLNEKDHYGTFPRNIGDTVFVDVLRNLRAFGADRAYTPIFESGYREYFFRLQNGNNCPFVIAHDVIMDRTEVDQLPIEIYYQSDIADTWESYVARSARELVSVYQARLGSFPYEKLSIVADADSLRHSGYREMLFVPRAIDDPSLLHTALAVQAARCWFADIYPDRIPADAGFDEGLAYYVAISTLHELLGDEAYQRIIALERDVFRPLCRADRYDEFFENVFKTVPSRLYMLRFVLGDSLLMQVIHHYADEYTFRIPGPQAFEMMATEASGGTLAWFFDQWRGPDGRLDYYFVDVRFFKDDSGHMAEGVVGNLGNVLMPVEMAFIMVDGDTLWDTLRYADFDLWKGQAEFSKRLPTKPRLLILDPNHFLPDVDRNNNYRPYWLSRFRYREPKVLFPGFRE
jgi:hypothetical protein